MKTLTLLVMVVVVDAVLGFNSSSFCADQGISIIADGTQISNVSSCSLTIQGILPAADKMISTLIISPSMNEKVD